jgi:MSHA biogenesis protein MshG
MAIYDYKGRTAAGELVEGRREAESSHSLAGLLSAASITPVSIDEVKAVKEFSESLKTSLGIGKPTLVDLILFSRQMYALTKSGIPIIRGLTLLAASVRNKIFADALHEVVEDLESGQSLSAAFAKHTDIFSPLYINLVRVGEESGDLDEAFLRLYQYLDSDKVTLNRIKTALFYPSMVLTAIVIAVAILMAFVIPKFALIYERFKLDLPIQTKIIIAISHFVQHYWLLLFIVTISLVIGLRNYVKTESGKLNWHRNKLKIPRIGDIILRATLARFARAFSMANIAGVPILHGLTITSKAVDNVYMEAKINNIRNDVERGETLTRAARSTHLFTPLVVQMLEVGEETGRLDEMMVEVAEFYEREVAYDIENLSKIIEPIMTVAMGLIVLLLALGVFLPMWDLVKITQR